MFRFRYATADDADELQRLAVRTYYETFAAVNTPGNMRAYLESAFALDRIRAELSDPAAVWLLALSDEAFAGYAKLLAGPPPECVIGDAPIELVRFYIDRQWHGSGLASELMQLCLEEARQRSFKTMYLGVWENNERAKAFYKKWNFVRAGEHVFPMGDDPQIDWWMTRRI
ncbi:MAG TPA: GNAT family N-acetyltransferase [Terriglobia bacterium]|jgi:ribosomal protein S18 acetylase RimI-like enzyme